MKDKNGIRKKRGENPLSFVSFGPRSPVRMMMIEAVAKVAVWIKLET